MHLYKQKKKFPYFGIIFSLVLFGVFAGYFLYGFSNVSDTVEKQQKETLQLAIDRAIISCYAIEGSYPPSITYLEEHYGIVIDKNKFIVSYQPLGGNIRPDAQVIVIGGGGE